MSSSTFLNLYYLAPATEGGVSASVFAKLELFCYEWVMGRYGGALRYAG